jgi:A1 cistron-splicing factor AAR2
MSSTTGSTILIVGLPPGSLCGIDLLSFTSTSQFQGIKQVPAGLHFLYAAATTAHSLRHGIWIQVSGDSSETILKKWDSGTEELVDVQSGESAKLRQNIASIWSTGLSPFRWSASDDPKDLKNAENDWKGLTSYVNIQAIERTLDGSHSVRSTSSAMEDIDDIPGLSTAETGTVITEELKFLPVNLEQTWRPGAFGRERTDAARDRSWALTDLIQNHLHSPPGVEILQELQITFVLILTLGNYSCFEQWKRVLTLCLTCSSRVKEYEPLFVQILKLLRLQLKHSDDVEGGMFDLSDQRNNLLSSLLKGFKRVVEDEDHKDCKDIRAALDSIETFVKKEFGWDLSDSYVRRGMIQLEDGEQVELELEDLEDLDERGEYAPVVVEEIDTIPSTDR